MKLNRFDEYNSIMPNVKAEIVHYPKQQMYATRLNFQVKNKGIIRAEAKADDVLKSINLAVEKIADQLHRIKTRYQK
jgi:ribosomal subunit interface protein